MYEQEEVWGDRDTRVVRGCFVRNRIVGPCAGSDEDWRDCFAVRRRHCLGPRARAGVQIAADQINEQGGLKLAGKTYKLEVIPYDDQYNAAQAKTAADRLVNRDEVKVIFGPVGSPGAMGSLPVTQPAKVIQFVDGYAPRS